jgi:hypothetical protein
MSTKLSQESDSDEAEEFTFKRPVAKKGANTASTSLTTPSIRSEATESTARPSFMVRDPISNPGGVLSAPVTIPEPEVVSTLYDPGDDEYDAEEDWS